MDGMHLERGACRLFCVTVKINPLLCGGRNDL